MTLTKAKWTAEEIWKDMDTFQYNDKASKLEPNTVFLSEDYVEKNYVRKEDIERIPFPDWHYLDKQKYENCLDKLRVLSNQEEK